MFLKSLRHFARAIIAKQNLAWEKNRGLNEENDIHVRILDKKEAIKHPADIEVKNLVGTRGRLFHW